MAARKRIKRRHLMLFYRRMASMASTGLNATESIRTLAEAGGKSELGRLIQSAYGEIKTGMPTGKVLRENFRHLSGIPDKIFESSGKEVSQIYGTIADHIEREEAVGNSFKGITVYPAFVGTVLMVVVGVILVFVIPVFREMFENLGGSLPPATRMLVAASALLKEILPVLILGIVALVITFSVHRSLRYAFVDMVPLLGRANRRAAAAEFMTTFSVLSGLGIPAGEGLMAAAESISNDYLARKLKAMALQAGKLDAFVEDMRRTGFLTDFTALMLRAGEKSGTVSTACSETARAVFEEVELFNRRFLGTAVPLMMASLGVAVGFIIIALYLPIFRLITLI